MTTRSNRQRMVTLFSVGIFAASSLTCQAYVSPLLQQQNSRNHGRMTGLKTQQKMRLPQFSPSEEKQKKLCLCPEESVEESEEDLLESQREMLFATLGSLWAASTNAFPNPANSVAGTDTKVAFLS